MNAATDSLVRSCLRGVPSDIMRCRCSLFEWIKWGFVFVQFVYFCVLCSFNGWQLQ